jgi:hypothetical protein
MKGLKPQTLIVRSAGREYSVSVKVDRTFEKAEPDVRMRRVRDDGLTTFTVKLPMGLGEDIESLEELLHATSMVNPSRRITYNLLGKENSLGSPQGFQPLERETAVQWYSYKQFEELFKDYVKAKPDAKLSEFISIFRGFARTKTIIEVINETNKALHAQAVGQNSISKKESGDTDEITITQGEGSAFLEMEKEATPLTLYTSIKDVARAPQALRQLLKTMKAKAKPIPKRSVARYILKPVGRESYEKLCAQNGWRNLRYVRLVGFKGECPRCYNGDLACTELDHVEFPFMVEVAVFDRDDAEGLKVYQCVNFMASMEDVFKGLFDVSYRLGRVGINAETPVTVVVHIVCPVLRWLDYGKTSIGEPEHVYVNRWGDSLGSVLRRAFDKVLPIPKTPKVYHPPPPPRPLSWVPHGRVGDNKYEERLKDFAMEILAIDAGRTNRIKYSARGWCYLLEGLGRIHKGEFDACEKAINDCRKIGLLPIAFVAEDQDITRRFSGLHQASDPTALLDELKRQVEEMLAALPSSTTDYWEGENYFVMMVVEKVDIYNIFEPICQEYKVPIANSKGWSPIRLRAHIASLSQWAESRGLTPVLLLFYDLDPAGWKISHKFRKNLWDISRATGWKPVKIIIDRFGLNEEDINRYNLTWIPGLKSARGREIKDEAYIKKFGIRKCESNALLRSDETLKAAEEICRRAIEKYYGSDAKERFRKKEEESKEKLTEVYHNPIWKNLFETIEEINRKLAKPKETKKETFRQNKMERAKEVEVKIYKGYYGVCPKCGQTFDYKEEDVDANKVVICRKCRQLIKLKWATAQDQKSPS